MHIIYNGWDISLTVPTIVALISFAQWVISRHDNKKKYP